MLMKSTFVNIQWCFSYVINKIEQVEKGRSDAQYEEIKEVYFAYSDACVNT